MRERETSRTLGKRVRKCTGGMCLGADLVREANNNNDNNNNNNNNIYVYI